MCNFQSAMSNVKYSIWKVQWAIFSVQYVLPTSLCSATQPLLKRLIFNLKELKFNLLSPPDLQTVLITLEMNFEESCRPMSTLQLGVSPFCPSKIMLTLLLTWRALECKILLAEGKSGGASWMGSGSEGGTMAFIQFVNWSRVHTIWRRAVASSYNL